MFLDPSHPFSRGLFFNYDFNNRMQTTCFDSGPRRLNTTVDNGENSDWAVTPRGLALDLDGTAERAIVPNTCEDVVGSATKTLCAWVIADTTTSTDRVFSAYISTGQTGMAFIRNGSTNWQYAYRNSGGFATVNGPTPTAGALVCLVGTQDHSTVRIWYNGEQEDENTDGIVPTITTPPNADIGCFDNNAGKTNPANFWDGKIIHLAMYDRAWSYEEAEHYFRDPWSKYTYFLPAAPKAGVAGGDTNISPPQANLTLTSVAPYLGFGLSPSLGDLSLSASAPTVEIDLPLEPGVADLTLTTTAAELDLNITTPVVDLVLDSQAPGVAVGRDITPGVGDLALDSQALSLDFGLTPSLVDLVLSSVAPTISTGFDLSPPRVDLSLDSQAPVLGDNLNLSQADLTLEGFAPSLGDSVSISVGQADLALSTTAPNIDSEIIVPFVSLALSTTAPTNVEAHRRVPNGAQLAMTGVGPIVDTGLLPKGDLTFISFAPDIRIGASWGPVTPDSESWTPVSADTEIWTPVSPDSESWT